MMKSHALGWVLVAALPSVACSGADSSGEPSGGASARGGSSAIASGGAGGSNNLGGMTAGGAVNPGAGGATGGTPGMGGTSVNSGGAIAAGGSLAGAVGAGGTLAGGSSSGGTGSGGKASGGKASGGSANGGASTGGKGSGGAATGGSASGGAAMGGAATGGATSCDWSDPPSNVAAWVNESWNAQLNGNIKGRKDWLIDNAMLGKGKINLCVRWGATTAPTATVKTGTAGAVEKWFNDWFGQLDGYGCFPHPKLSVRVTGWAVKPGNTSWVSDLDSSIKVYTETDSDGEPKCPDACSFFNNWTHQFPNCAGGEAYHTDYWMWIDDTIDGAEAVGGDWGLRMSLTAFVRAMTQGAAYDLNTVEHEMGHGFGFQDYYDWTGSKPAGGSLMIIENPLPSSPTIADRWLIRRTWKEMKALRGW